jgi:hypothetical protein
MQHNQRPHQQDKRSLKMGLDFGLSLGKKVNHNATVDSETTKKVAEGDNKTRAFTLSKCVETGSAPPASCSRQAGCLGAG